jgi:hypothetical protein
LCLEQYPKALSASFISLMEHAVAAIAVCVRNEADASHADAQVMESVGRPLRSRRPQTS